MSLDTLNNRLQQRGVEQYIPNWKKIRVLTTYEIEKCELLLAGPPLATPVRPEPALT